MIYLDSDNDLEAYQLEDLEEMAAVGSTPQVQVVVLADRSPDGEDDQDGCSNDGVVNLGNWQGARLLSAEKGKLEQLEDWGPTNMAVPATLTRFMKEARERYPARRYALIVADHGDGFNGACLDDSAPPEDILTLAELSGSLRGAGLEVLGFDCCLMGTLEVALAVAPGAHYMVASEELEPGQGWAYKALLEQLQARPEMDGAELGRLIADTFKSSFPADDDDGLALTLSVVDLTRLGPVREALDALGGQLAGTISHGGRKAWVGAARARSRAEEYGVSDDGEPGSNLHDLVDLADKLGEQVPALAEPARALEEATRQAVVYSIRGKARPQAHGLSVFFPPGSEDDSPDYARLPQLAQGWLGFLRSYLGQGEKDRTPPRLTKVEASAEAFKLGERITVSGRVKGDDVESCSFVLVQNYEDGQEIIGSLPVEVAPDGRLEKEWDGRWFALGDKEGSLTVTVTNVQPAEDGGFLVTCPAQWQRKKKSRWKDVTLYLYLEPKEDDELSGKLIYAMLDEDGEAIREVDLKPGNRLRAVYLEIDENGDEVYAPDENESDVLVVGEEGIDIDMLDVDPGSYSVGFTATDLAGNTDEMLTEVEIKE